MAPPKESTDSTVSLQGGDTNKKEPETNLSSEQIENDFQVIDSSQLDSPPPEASQDDSTVAPVKEGVKDKSDASLENIVKKDGSMPGTAPLVLDNLDHGTTFHCPPPAPMGHGYNGHHIPEPVKEVQRGNKAEVKQLYQGPKKCPCCTNWVEEPPAGSNKEMVTKAKWGEFAVVVRKTAHGGDSSWKLHSITVNSQHILDILRKHLSTYPGLALETDEVQFTPPFAPLLHFWPEIVHTATIAEDARTSEQFHLFRKVLEPELALPIQKAEECFKHGKIEFDYLWTLFKPGALVYWNKDNQGNIARLKQSESLDGGFGRAFRLRAEQIDFDGNKFGYKEVIQTIKEYEGRTSIYEHAMPLDIRSDKETIQHDLIQRGRKFEALHGYHFKAYEGTASTQNAGPWSMRSSAQSIGGRVIIDATTYYGTVPPPPLTPLKGQITPLPVDPTQVPPPMPHPSFGYGNNPYGPPPYTDDYRSRRRRKQVPAYMDNGVPSEVDVPTNIKPLSDDELMLCVSYVPGFMLKTKRWEILNVSGITDIIWENIFDCLVLPNQSKDLLLAFAKSKTHGDALFDDFVGGKGKGIIMLLSGPPGVGKTLTAEAIAEKLQVPLYTLSAGELGVVPATVEMTLQHAMNNCARWNAVLLLDECDVFLEKREINSLKRNELVSIFLRSVEYYQGIMLLTTNRIATIDPAFNSRVDVAISYDDLNAELRLHIWENFIDKLRNDGAAIDDSSLDASALKSLAKHELNGRQIKSLVKTAQLLARSKDQALGIEHLEAVVSLNKLRDGRIST